MEETITKLTCKQKILKHLEFIERDLGWLSKKTGIPYPTLYSIFKQNIMNLNQGRLDQINLVCDTKFELDLPAEPA